MKRLGSGLRVWIAGVSFLSFLGGWVVFAHSNVPGGDASSPAAQVAPSSPAGSLTSGNSQARAPQPAPPATRPRLRTRGS
jgi:hypothetical protein